MKKTLASIFVFVLLAAPAISRAGFLDLFRFDWTNMGAQAKVAVTAEVKKETFTRGDRAAEISYIQTILAKKGYYKGKINGLIGIKTETAIKNWQVKNGLKITGILDKDTVESIIGVRRQNYSLRGGSTSVNIKMLLGGSYDATSGLMSTALNDGNLIPSEDPYSDLNYYLTVGVSDITGPEIFDVTGPDAIVDWVIVELRNKDNMKDLEYSTAALLQADGDIVADDGVSPLALYNLTQNYFYVLVGHRNHLPIITETPVNILEPIDMTTAALFHDITMPGSAAKMVNGKQVLWPGDVNDDRRIIYTGEDNDREVILTAIGGDTPTNILTGQYRLEDVNMDGVVKYVGANNDRDIILQSVGGSTPTNTLTAQIPELYPIVVQLISTSSVLNDNGAQDPNSATFSIRFKVTNYSDEDIEIPLSHQLADGTHILNEGLEYASSSDSGQLANNIATSLTCISSCSNGLGGDFFIGTGENETFDLTTIFQAQADGFFKVYLNSVNWAISGSPLSADEFYTIDLGHAFFGTSPFSTPYIFLNAN